MAKGYLKPEDLDKAWRIVRETGEKDISKVLVQLGMVGEREVMQAKAMEMGFAFVDLERIKLDPETVHLIPSDFARSAIAIPVKRDGNNLWVALGNPKDSEVLDTIKLITGCRVIPVFAIPHVIEEVIASHYPNRFA